jgi:hypothetical protein
VDQYYENPEKYAHSEKNHSEKLEKNHSEKLEKNHSEKSEKNHFSAEKSEKRAPVQAPVQPPLQTPLPPRTVKAIRFHTNAVIQAGEVRAHDEQEMQSLLQSVQMRYRIYNPEIEPEHESDYYCNCDIHQYKRRKWQRLSVQQMWSKAVMYPGESSYHDCYQQSFFSSNPYTYNIISPYGYRMGNTFWTIQQPQPGYHARMVHQTIAMNASLNAQAQAAINAQEPKSNIWATDELEAQISKLAIAGPPADGKKKSSRFSSGLKQAFSIKSPEEKALIKTKKQMNYAIGLQSQILDEEQSRWPDQLDRQIVLTYQDKIGMTSKIADLRNRCPIQYLHLLRAGYFEPIPVAWADLASNPLKFSIEAASGWRGITPAWRGFEDTAEERLYWVMNHRDGAGGPRLKPDMISALDMARARMASAVEPPPGYYSADDTCHVQHTSAGYSKQVMPPPFRAFDAPEAPTDDTMILLDVSGSMGFDPVRPNYNQYLITGYSRSTQPKNKGNSPNALIDPPY